MLVPRTREQYQIPLRVELQDDEVPLLEVIFTDAAGRQWRREGTSLEPWPAQNP